MSNTELISVEELKAAFPTKKNAITKEIVDVMNRARTEPEFQGATLLQSAITYESVMQKNKASLKDYLNAIRFSAYLISMDDNYTEAYKKVFWDRDFVKNRVTAPTESTEYKELTSAASRYGRSKLVVDILTLSQVPLDMMFAGARYKAVGVLANEMVTAKFPKDRIMAAKELLAATKGPDNMKIELDVGVQENSAVDQLNAQLAEMAAKQKTLLEQGVSNLAELGGMKVKQDDVLEGEVVDG